MDVNGSPEFEEMHQAGQMAYREGYVCVFFQEHGCRDDALMHDRAVVGVYTGTPKKPGEQLFRAWVDAAELPLVLAHWATVLR